MQHIESEHQKALIQWSQHHKLPNGMRISELLIAVPNGGARNKRTAAILRAEGVKKGVSDLELVYPSGGYGALWIELKRPIVKGKTKPKATPEQLAWIERVRAVGHQAVVCYGWHQARAVILAYLELSP